MPDQDRSKEPPPTVETAVPPKAENASAPPSEKSGSTPAKEAQPCCCNIVIRVDEIKVEKLTDAGSLPGFSSLFGLAADHVFIKAIDCSGKVKNYPDDDKGIKLDKGEHAGGFEIATVVPEHDNGCHVHCNINIIVRKSSKLNVILDEIARIRAELFALSADLAKAMQDFAKNNTALQTALASGGATSAAFLAALAALSADQAQMARIQSEMTSLTNSLTELLKALVGTDDTLMDQFELALLGRLPCGDKHWAKVLQAPPGWTLDKGNPDRATVEFDMEHLGGKWTMRLSAIRDCDH
jgi:hypothetical protein